jgi:spermidine synthase
LKNSNGHFVKLSLSIALLSIAIISYQLSLIQSLSIVQWYHFSYLVISIALLGFGAAGTFIAIFRNRLLNRFNSLLPIFMIICGLLMTVVVAASQIPFIQFDSHHLFSEYSNFWKLLITYLLFFLPFFFGALAIGLVFVKYVDVIGKMYFANMFGSGLGGLVIVGIMWIFQPLELPSVIALLPIIAGLIIIPKKKRALKYFISIAALVFVFISFFSSPKLKLSEYKSLSKVLNLPDTEIIKSKSSPYGLIDIVSSQHIRYAPGLSINYPSVVTINDAVFKNGNWLGPLSFQKTDTTDYFSYSTTALPYIMNKQNKVLILGAGIGNQVEQALSQNVEEIIAVEPDIALTSFISEMLKENGYSTYNQKNVLLSSVTPRTHLMKSESTYDLIVLPIIGSFGGSSGLFAMHEQYILTKEAFNNMWQRLNDNGIISVVTYIDYPYRKPIKILATITEVLEDEGINKPAEHIAAIKNWNTISIAVKKNKISSIEAERIREFCVKMNFDPVILPDIKEEEQRRFNRLQDDSFYDYIDQILSSQKEREKLYSQNAFNIKPSTDNQPYFSQFLQWESIPQMTELFGADAVPFFEIGYLVLYITLIQTVLLSIILIILPLFNLGLGGRGKAWSLIGSLFILEM